MGPPSHSLLSSFSWSDWSCRLCCMHFARESRISHTWTWISIYPSGIFKAKVFKLKKQYKAFLFHLNTSGMPFKGFNFRWISKIEHVFLQTCLLTQKFCNIKSAIKFYVPIKLATFLHWNNFSNSSIEWQYFLLLLQQI